MSRFYSLSLYRLSQATVTLCVLSFVCETIRLMLIIHLQWGVGRGVGGGGGVGLGGKSKFSNAVLLIFEDPRIV